MLDLTRPLVVFDIESTGVVPQRDRIVEIAVLKITPDGESRNTVRRLNPQIPIPPSATAIHGISDADVADCPVFADIADKSGGILRLYKAAFKEFCASDNGLKRSFQFVGNVCGELLAVTLCKGAVCNIENKNDNAESFAVRFNGVNSQLILIPASFLGIFAVITV